MSRPPRTEDAPGLTTDPGLCAGCRWQTIVSSQRSAFMRCALSDVDDRFPRYPNLPVTDCSGYRPVAADEG